MVREVLWSGEAGWLRLVGFSWMLDIRGPGGAACLGLLGTWHLLKAMGVRSCRVGLELGGDGVMVEWRGGQG